METTTYQQLDELAQRISVAITEKRGVPTQVHHLHHATSSMLCLGKFGANMLIKASSPAELLVRAEGFLQGLCHPGATSCANRAAP